MTGALLVLLSLAALCASTALLSASWGAPVLADTLAAIAALSGLVAFIMVVVFTVRRARRAAGTARP